MLSRMLRANRIGSCCTKLLPSLIAGRQAPRAITQSAARPHLGTIPRKVQSLDIMPIQEDCATCQNMRKGMRCSIGLFPGLGGHRSAESRIPEIQCREQCRTVSFVSPLLFGEPVLKVLSLTGCGGAFAATTWPHQCCGGPWLNAEAQTIHHGKVWPRRIAEVDLRRKDQSCVQIESTRPLLSAQSPHNHTSH